MFRPEFRATLGTQVIAPAKISASPAVTTIPVEATVPESPAASANGTVSPSDIPITMITHALKNASRSALIWFLCVVHNPCGAPGQTLSCAFGASFTAA